MASFGGSIPGYPGISGNPVGGGGGGFSWGSLFSNPLVLQMMASMGASLDPEGPAGAIGGVTNQWIQNKSYMEMMKKMLAGGAKMTLGDGKFSIGGETSKLVGAFGSGGGQESLSEDWMGKGFQNAINGGY